MKSKVYPCVCRATFYQNDILVSTYGLSLRMQGHPWRFITKVAQFRFIPAYAGPPPTVEASEVVEMVYPWVCRATRVS